MLAHLPQKFGDYVLLSPLGQGGMSEVYLAMSGHRDLETLCVVKRLRPALLPRPDEVARFRHEADLARRLVHGNIAHTHNIGEVEGEVFLVQELVEGHDLSDFIAELNRQHCRLPIGVAAYIVGELARGLSYAHDFENLSLVHRDINLPNVRLTYSGEVKLLDFGIASSNLHGGEERSEGAAGKLWHLAPEQVRPGGIVDRRSDLYALGVVLWELLTQRPVGTRREGEREMRTAETEGEVLVWITRGEHDPPSKFNKAVTPSLDIVVNKAMSLDPEDRFQTADELRSALVPFIASAIRPERWLSERMEQLFGPEREREERRRLIESARALLDAPSSRQPRRSATYRKVGRARSRWADKAVWLVPVGLGALVGLGVLLWLRSRSEDGRDAVEHTAAATDAQAPLPAPRTATVDKPMPSGPRRLAVIAVDAGQPGKPRVDEPTGSQPPPPGTASHAGPRATVAGTATRPPSVATGSGGSRALAGEPAKVDHLAQARDAFNARDWNRALSAGRAAVVAGGGAEAHAMVGNTCFKMGRYAEAEQAYKKALALDPKNALLAERLRIANVRAQESAKGKEP